LYVHFKSSSNYNWTCQRPKLGVFKQKLSLFVSLPAALWPKCCNVTNMTQCDQNDAMWPTWRSVTTITQCDQHDAMWPTWRNVTNMTQCDQNFPVQWFLCLHSCFNGLLSFSIPNVKNACLKLKRRSWHSFNLRRYSLLDAACTLCSLKQDCFFGLHLIALYCFLLHKSWQWVLTGHCKSYFLSPFRFSDFCQFIVIFLPLSCHYDLYILDTIIVKQYCPRSSFHDSSRSVSCTQDLSWDSADNVLRVNLTLTPIRGPTKCRKS